MNSMINGSKLLAAALCAATLAACNAVEDVDEGPTAALPGETAVLGGNINDLGTRRPLVLTLDGADACLVPVSATDPSGPRILSECQFFGISDQKASVFSFGAKPVGRSYTVAVKRQPYGKVCQFDSGGTTKTISLSASTPEIIINCADDPAVLHYTVAINIAPAAAAKPGLQVMLTTENGTCPVNVNGRSTITFSSTECPDGGLTSYHRNATYIFDSGILNGTNRLPVTPWRVTASIPGATSLAPRTACFVTGGPQANTGGNINDSGVATVRPSGNIAPGTLNVVACGFTVRAQADYSRGPTEATDPAIAPGDGITVLMRSQPYGVDVASAKITSFANTFIPFMVPDANGDPTATVYEAQSDINAFYELVVKQSPAGMACTAGFSTTSGNPSGVGTAAHSTRTVAGNTDGFGILLRRPSSGTVALQWVLDKVVRCRRVAANPRPLRGSYWQYTTVTTTRSPIVTGAPGLTGSTAVTTYNRNILTFFEDGQYVYGTHNGSTLTNGEGIETGFYAYNPSTNLRLSASATQYIEPGQMVFNGMVDINGGAGFHSGAGVPRVLNNVVETAGPPRSFTAEATSSATNARGLVLGGGSLTVSIAGFPGISVASGTYNTAPNTPGATVVESDLATLVTRINTAATSSVAGTPLAGTFTTIASATPAGEIQIVAPAGGPVAFGGAAVASLGLPATVAQGTTGTSTSARAFMATLVQVRFAYTLAPIGPDPRVTTTNALDGTWVAWDLLRKPAPVEDIRRVMAYQHGAYNVYHFGNNGLPNFQATCLAGNFGLIGTWTRQGSGQGCSMTITTDTSTNGAPAVRTVSGSQASGDSPLTGSRNASLPDFPGRWPQSQTPDRTDGRPYSLVEYEVRLAGTQPTDPICPNLDKVTVWDTVSGVRKDTLNPPIPRIVMCRIVPN